MLTVLLSKWDRESRVKVQHNECPVQQHAATKEEQREDDEGGGAITCGPKEVPLQAARCGNDSIQENTHQDS